MNSSYNRAGLILAKLCEGDVLAIARDATQAGDWTPWEVLQERIAKQITAETACEFGNHCLECGR